ncbi:MAG: DUF3524 domain-containing protein, partial [Pseudomonadales bacterium]|nr:DUF3524 domain-containing protein [Pseudomonadales bacterium]
MNTLILSPYDAVSHRAWHQGLVTQLAGHDLTVLTMADRHFSWRFRGNSLWYSTCPELHSHWDLVIATSMTDLATLKGLVPELAGTPVVVYFHENQFAYPSRQAGEHLIERQMTSIYSALAADRLVF